MSLATAFFAASMLFLGVSAWHWLRVRASQRDLNAPPTDPWTPIDAAVQEGLESLDRRLSKIEREFADWLEHVEERIDRGNKAYGRARAAERRLEELHGDETREGPGPARRIRPGDGEGSEGEGVHPVSDFLGLPPGADPVQVANAALVLAQLRRGIHGD